MTTQTLSNRTMTTVGQLIREHREQAGLTQADLGRRAVVNINQLNKYERDHHQPTLPVLLRLAGALEVDVSQLTPAPMPVTVEQQQAMAERTAAAQARSRARRAAERAAAAS